MTLSSEVGDKTYVAYCLEGLAAIVASEGRLAWAARLWGAAEALLETIEVTAYPYAPDRSLYQEQVAAARARLDEQTWVEAWAEGRAMSTVEAVQYALESSKTLDEPAASPAYPAGLSAREVEVLRLVAKGMTNAQIAKELYISPRTVNAHLGSIYHKIGSSTRAEATRFASEHNLL